MVITEQHFVLASKSNELGKPLKFRLTYVCDCVHNSGKSANRVRQYNYPGRYGRKTERIDS